MSDTRTNDWPPENDKRLLFWVMFSLIAMAFAFSVVVWAIGFYHGYDSLSGLLTLVLELTATIAFIMWMPRWVASRFKRPESHNDPRPEAPLGQNDRRSNHQNRTWETWAWAVATCAALFAITFWLVTRSQ